MNADTFFSYLTNPALITEYSSKELDAVITEFPYFETAYLLQAKAANNNKSIHYATKLKLASVYANDRIRLYELLSQTNQVVISPPIISTVKEEIKVEEKVIEPKVEIKAIEVVETAPTPVIVATETTELKSEKRVETPVVIEKETIAITETPVEEKVESTISLAKQISEILPIENHTVVAKTELEIPIEKQKVAIEVSPLIEKLSEEKETLDNVEKEVLTEVLNQYVANEVEQIEPQLTIDKTANEIITKTEKPVVDFNSPHSFTEWLKLAQLNKQNSDDKNLIAQTAKINPKVNLQKKVAQLNLIERFIEKEPKIASPKKTEFFNPVNKAKESAEEDFSFVTETLAKIYHQQGNSSKALKAYEHLSLKFPEKSAYFASQIEKIKEQLKK
ncbi:MAG: hypothetical protein V4667_12745 [Bacteroidota bacterium]